MILTKLYFDGNIYHKRRVHHFMKKPIKITAIILSLLLIIGACTWKIYFSSFKTLWYSPFHNVVFKMTITSGASYPTYYYLLESNGVLQYAKGQCMNSRDIRSKKSLISTDFTGKKKLSIQNAEYIMSLLNRVEEKGPNVETFWSDGDYNVILLYKDEVYISSPSSGNADLRAFSFATMNITQMQLDYSKVLF